MTEEELRCHAIDRYQNGESPISIYQDINRSKQWFFKWLNRYQSGDPQWYRSKSQAPLNRPAQIDAADRQRIVNIRQHLEAQPYAQVGVSAIKWELHKAGSPIPSDRTINRILKQEGLVKKNSICPERGSIPVLYRGFVPQQHPSGRHHRTPLYQRRRPFLFVQCHRCSNPYSLYRVMPEPGGPTDRLQALKMLESDGNAGLSPTGQRIILSRKQPLSAFFRNGNPIVPALWRHPGIYTNLRALAKRCHRTFQRLLRQTVLQTSMVYQLLGAQAAEQKFSTLSQQKSSLQLSEWKNATGVYQ